VGHRPEPPFSPSFEGHVLERSALAAVVRMR
jgi:hypothetical protein